MTSALCMLTTDDMSKLAGALRSGRLVPPFSPLGLRRYVPESLVDRVAIELQRRLDGGNDASHLAECLEIVCQDRGLHPVIEDQIDLVWTGPEAPGIVNRDTGVVVREMFRNAKQSVLVAGYAVYQGRDVFKELANRMDGDADLRVKMYLDIQRPRRGRISQSQVIRNFADRFVHQQWPGRRLPELFYDPRSLEMGNMRRASLHAKCVVVDNAQAFVSSANFTKAAQTKNIEVGIYLKSSPFARRLTKHFETLAALKILIPIGVTQFSSPVQ